MQTRFVPRPTPYEQILAVIEREKTAMSSGDVEMYFSVLADDAVYLPPNASAKQGTELRAWVAGFLRHFSVEWVQWTEGEITVAGSLAYHDYVYKMKSTPRAGGDAVIGVGKGLEIFRCEPNGSWKIVRHMWNATPERIVR